ncbi:MAG: AAA family ATPase [bacterium]|nr:AAA family ATPase [bacterium]
MVVVVMGPAGAGKTTVGRRLAETLGWAFHDGDDVHPAANVAKMRRGEPLTDADRAGWLAALHELIAALGARGADAVLACSALRAAHRDVLAGGRDDVRFVYLRVPPDELRRRLEARRGHYMHADLLPSQLATLEEPGDAITLDGTRPPDELAAAIRAALAS